MPSHAIAHFMAFFCCCFFFVYTESATPESRVQAIHCLVHKLPERNRLVLSLVTKHLAKWVETAFSLSFYLYTQFFVCTFSVSFLQPFYFSRPSATIFYHYFQLSPSFHSYRQYTNTHLPTGSTLRTFVGYLSCWATEQTDRQHSGEKRENSTWTFIPFHAVI